MSLIRPEVSAMFMRWREVIAAAGLVLLGLWFYAIGGWLLGAVGIVAALAGLSLGLVALRRLRFARPVTDPGIVEVLEGQISYMGPHGGGWVALSELTELSLVRQEERQVWRLRQAGDRVLDVPVGATGADGLFDVFAALPGIDPGALIRALNRKDVAAQSLWLRQRGPALTWTPQEDRSSR